MHPGVEPRYRPAEAAGIIGMPVPTLRTWFRGWSGGKPPVLATDRGTDGPLTLSFFNVVEARFLDAYRRRGVSMQRVRRALNFVSEHLPGFERPLLKPEFETDGRTLFIELQEAGKTPMLLDATGGGQLVWPEAVREHFQSLVFDDRGDPSRLWLDDRRSVMLDPRFGWGLPVIAESGVRTDVLFERFEAGESFDAIAEDFSLNTSDVETGVAWEQTTRQAA